MNNDMTKLYLIPDQVVAFTEWNKGKKKFITSNFWSDVKFEIHINDIQIDLKNINEAQKILNSILERSETVSQNTNHFVNVLASNDEFGWNFSEYYSKSIISEALEGTPDLENFTLIGEDTSMEWHNKEMTLNEFGEVTDLKDEQGKNLNLEEIIETDFLYDGLHSNLESVGWKNGVSDLLLKTPFKLKNKKI